MARRFGATENELDGVRTGDLNCFEPREGVALEFSQALTFDSNHVSDELFERLRTQYNEGEVIEISAVAGIFNYFNRFNNALQMEPTR